MTPRILQRAGFVLALLGLIPAAALGERLAVSPEEARAIARDAYIYGFPLVDSYRIQYSYFVDRASPEYKAPWNQLRSIPRLFTPEDKAVQTPNSDTPYSMIGLDLRAEPIVLTVPPIDAKRYFSIQLVDAYTYNFDYIGSRTTGNGGGRFLVAGPGWKGDDARGHQQGVPFGNRTGAGDLPHAALRSRRPREPEAGAGRLQGASRCRLSSERLRPHPRRRSTSRQRSHRIRRRARPSFSRC